MTLVIGCYTAEMDGSGTGLSVVPGGTLAAPSPSFAISDGSIVYAVHEMSEGSVGSYALSPAGELTHLSTQSTGGVWPCHLALHDGYLLAANYGSGSVSVHPVEENGVIGAHTDLVQHQGHGPNPDRQEGPHAHQVVIAPDGTVTVVDLGIDRLVHYRLADGKLHRVGETAVPAGSGPRHYVVHPDGRWFVAAELGSAVLVVRDGSYIGSVPATVSDVHNQPSAIALSADARFVYLANRGADTIAVFRVGDELSYVGEVSCGGEWPRDLVRDGDLLLVANQKSDSVVTFRLGRDGLPVPTGEVAKAGSPTSILSL